MEEMPLTLLEESTELSDGPISVQPTTPQPPAMRMAVSASAMELLKIDSFSAMAKLAMPDIREERVQEAKKRFYTKESYRELIQKILSDP